MATTIDENDYEYDFIAAATQAAVERENREAQSKAAFTARTTTKKNPMSVFETASTTSAASMATTMSTTMPPTEDDYEYDFIAAATQAAVERENREAQAKAEADAFTT